MSYSEHDAAMFVADGVALLDRVRPDWWQGLDLDQLNMRDGDWCVIGQVFGSWYEGMCDLRDMGEDVEPSARFGFNAWGDSDDEFGALARVWRTVVEHRRGSSPGQ